MVVKKNYLARTTCFVAHVFLAIFVVVILCHCSSGNDENTKLIEGKGYIVFDKNVKGGSYAKGRAVVVDKNDKIYVTGTNGKMTIWRYHEDGTLDVDYGENGLASHNKNVIGRSSGPGDDIVLDKNSRAVVTGSEPWSTVIFKGSNDRYSYKDMVLWRYNSVGDMDPFFGNNGVAIGKNTFRRVNTKVYPDQELVQNVSTALVITEDGKIINTGYTKDDSRVSMVIRRYHADGTPDKSFGKNGVVYFQRVINRLVGSAGNAIALGGDGKILVAGKVLTGTVEVRRDDYAMALWRYNSNGSLDRSFGDNGLVVHDNAAGGNGSDEAFALIVDSAGRILCTGYSTKAKLDRDMVIWRFTKDGKLDKTFGENGLVKYSNNQLGCGGALEGDTAGSNDLGRDIKMTAEGKIIVAGYSDTVSKTKVRAITMQLWRYNQDGTLDKSFAGDGVACNQGGAGVGYNSRGWSLALDRGGRAIVAGSRFKFSDNVFDLYNQDLLRYEDVGMVLWRYKDDGVLDRSFGRL